MNGYMRDLACRTPHRGEPIDGCPHPSEDQRLIPYGVYDAWWCAWCGGIVLLGVRG